MATTSSISLPPPPTTHHHRPSSRPSAQPPPPSPPCITGMNGIPDPSASSASSASSAASASDPPQQQSPASDPPPQMALDPCLGWDTEACAATGHMQLEAPDMGAWRVGGCVGWCGFGLDLPAKKAYVAAWGWEDPSGVYVRRREAVGHVPTSNPQHLTHPYHPSPSPVSPHTHPHTHTRTRTQPSWRRWRRRRLGRRVRPPASAGT